MSKFVALAGVPDDDRRHLHYGPAVHIRVHVDWHRTRRWRRSIDEIRTSRSFGSTSTGRAF